jgi:hypothetical protein
MARQEAKVASHMEMFLRWPNIFLVFININSQFSGCTDFCAYGDGFRGKGDSFIFDAIFDAFEGDGPIFASRKSGKSPHEN